jgi:hypothetical protein
MDYAEEFKKAIEENEGDKAADILLNWKDRQDANNKYAFVIFDGMPPSELRYDELMKWMNEAKEMEAKNPSLKAWYMSTALHVVTINVQEYGVSK